ncbi:hypothetical protein AVEN_78151-1 [Araneus ventricosus]|uniref:Uncharacterized protein n=1 Tax=Araneus ventricosus TaxID=182803 RepID=A0A4Y2MSS8_ARAVE|nr:hypothetical protein AVEN_78151-1 [Araneus ventricosus]
MQPLLCDFEYPIGCKGSDIVPVAAKPGKHLLRPSKIPVMSCGEKHHAFESQAGMYDLEFLYGLKKGSKEDVIEWCMSVDMIAKEYVCPTCGSLELIKLIQSSADYEQEAFEDILEAVTSARIQKERVQQEEEREENEFHLKKMGLEIEAKRIESTTGDRVKSLNRCASSDTKI